MNSDLIPGYEIGELEGDSFEDKVNFVVEQMRKDGQDVWEFHAYWVEDMMDFLHEEKFNENRAILSERVKVIYAAMDVFKKLPYFKHFPSSSK